jgi:hypothetical protein
MFDPTGGETGEVEIIREDRVRRFILLKLGKEALIADPNFEWIEFLTEVNVLELLIGIRKRRHPQIAQDVRERGVAKTAFWGVHRVTGGCGDEESLTGGGRLPVWQVHEALDLGECFSAGIAASVMDAGPFHNPAQGGIEIKFGSPTKHGACL